MTPLAVTERHRKKQLTIVGRVLKLLFPTTASLRAALDPGNPSVVMADWLDLASNTIFSGRSESARASHDYYAAVKKAATGSTETPLLDEVYTAPDVDRVRSSLLATGPGVYRRRLIQGDSDEQAFKYAQAALLGAATRHVLDGSRSLIDATVGTDQQAVGWIRVTDGDPCAFCAMLATRGFAAMKNEGGLYQSKQSATRVVSGRGSRKPGERYHDNCGCTAMPVFSRDFEIPGDAEKWDKLYADSTRNASGADKLKAFRKAYDEMRKGPVEPSEIGKIILP